MQRFRTRLAAGVAALVVVLGGGGIAMAVNGAPSVDAPPVDVPPVDVP